MSTCIYNQKLTSWSPSHQIYGLYTCENVDNFGQFYTFFSMWSVWLAIANSSLSLTSWWCVILTCIERGTWPRLFTSILFVTINYFVTYTPWHSKIWLMYTFTIVSKYIIRWRNNNKTLFLLRCKFFSHCHIVIFSIHFIRWKWHMCPQLKYLRIQR